jgi:hypothetical protein
MNITNDPIHSQINAFYPIDTPVNPEFVKIDASLFKKASYVTNAPLPTGEFPRFKSFN